ncbi:hypothetical protein HRbin36_00809 [bacterium HR36]|nr:hypothetical protein HRbin36_00809 [bacterium HR36]
MQNAGGHEPAGARLQAIGFAVIQDAVIAFVPALETSAYVFLSSARFQPEKCIGKIIADTVELRGEIIGFGFTLLADERRLLVILMHVMRDRAEVIEEFAINRPAMILLPHRFADK